MNTRFAVGLICVLAIVSWQVGGAHAQATPAERPPPSIQEEEQEQPAEGEAPLG